MLNFFSLIVLNNNNDQDQLLYPQADEPSMEHFSVNNNNEQ